jgi:hypothetical protein
MEGLNKLARRCVIATAVCAAAWSSASAGVFSKKDACECEECGKPKKKCCFKAPPAAPEAGVAFAIPGVVRSGQAVRVNEADVRRAVREAAARQVEREAGERPAAEKSTEDRLNALESDVQQLRDLMERLTVAVDKLADEAAKK